MKSKGGGVLGCYGKERQKCVNNDKVPNSQMKFFQGIFSQISRAFEGNFHQVFEKRDNNGKILLYLEPRFRCREKRLFAARHMMRSFSPH